MTTNETDLTRLANIFLVGYSAGKTVIVNRNRIQTGLTRDEVLSLVSWLIIIEGLDLEEIETNLKEIQP